VSVVYLFIKTKNGEDIFNLLSDRT